MGGLVDLLFVGQRWERERTSTSPDFVKDTLEKVELIRKRLLTAQSQLKSNADR